MNLLSQPRGAATRPCTQVRTQQWEVAINKYTRHCQSSSDCTTSGERKLDPNADVVVKGNHHG